jgi:hypothetical protein
MSAGATGVTTTFVDLRPGWRHVRLAPVDGEVWGEGIFEALEWLVGRVLGGHGHRCRRWGQSIVVEIAPPNAPGQLGRLKEALTQLAG